MMQDLKRAQEMTVYYHYLQGLKSIPFGLACLAFAGMIAAAWRIPAVLAFLVVLGIAPWLYLRVTRYYDQAFGRVEPLRGKRRLRWLGMLTVALTAVIAIRIDQHAHLRVSVFGVQLALVALLGCWRSLRRRPYWLILLALLAGLSLLPLTGAISSAQVFGRGGWLGWATLGAIFIVGGISDHLLLVHELAPLPGEHHAASV